MAKVIIHEGELRALLSGGDGAVLRDIYRRAERVRSRAVELAPVDTGRLKNSITWRLVPNGAIVGTNVEYAAYQEFGTRYMAAHPYLRPSLEAAR